VGIVGVAAFGSPEGLSSALPGSSELLAAEDLDPEVRRQLQSVRLLGLFQGGRAAEAYELACQLLPTLPLQDAADEGILATWTGIVLATGSGLFSNPQAAERLVLSVRTVESHRYRAMQKLGIRDRHQLPRRPQ
jgi:DNA-binding NarL/FixJ family response regulator